MSEDSRLERIENKIDKLSDGVADIHVTLAKQHAVLEEHQKRSMYNEKAVDLLSKEFKPVRDHVMYVQKLSGWAKILIGSGLLIEIIRLYLSRKGI